MKKTWQGVKWGRGAQEGWILTKNWLAQIVVNTFVLSLWVSMLRDLLFGDAAFKKFCHFMKITCTLFHFCPGNCVGRWENSQYRFYWKINFFERKYGDEIFPWNFKALQKIVLVEKIHFCKNVLLYVTNVMQILSCNCVFIWSTNFLRPFLFLHPLIPFSWILHFIFALVTVLVDEKTVNIDFIER